MQTTTASRRDELVVVEQLSVVDVGLLGEEEGEEVEVGRKASTSGSGTVLRAVSCERSRVVGRSHRGRGGGSGSGSRGRGRVDPRARWIRMLGFGRRSPGVHEASEPRLARGGKEVRRLQGVLLPGAEDERASECGTNAMVVVCRGRGEGEEEAASASGYRQRAAASREIGNVKHYAATG